MSWSLKGSYFETCSCDLMCPCNMSMDHGATYDYCRVTLVFDIACRLQGPPDRLGSVYASERFTWTSNGDQLSARTWVCERFLQIAAEKSSVVLRVVKDRLLIEPPLPVSTAKFPCTVRWKYRIWVAGPLRDERSTGAG